jgi:beta-glucosidase
MGVAAIEGLQGDDFLIDRHHVMATAKHFAVHGQPEGGTNTAPGNYSERVIRENFLVPFQAAVRKRHVGSVMASYNEIDGVPSHVNHWLLDRCCARSGVSRLRDVRWRWPADAVQHASRGRPTMPTRRGWRSPPAWTTTLSDGSVYRTLLGQVKQGIVPESEVDRAAARVLAAKFRLGLFDNPYVDPDYAERSPTAPSIAAREKRPRRSFLCC